MSWRDETPAAVQDDLDAVLGAALEAAQSFLERSGEFYPFGVSLTPDGIGLVAAHDESAGDHPASADVHALVVEALRSSGEARAVAVVAPVVADGGDAVRAELEHHDGGPALVVLLPYAVSRLRKRVTYGELRAGTGTRQVWRS